MEILSGIFIPFIGTAAGAACVLFMKGALHFRVQKALLGFAGGVMVAACVWSLLMPAMEMSAGMGRLAFLPASIGFAGGIAFLFALDELVPHLHIDTDKPEGIRKDLRKSTMLILAVTIHNIPEGMAVGVIFAGVLSGKSSITLADALALSVGIAIQNFPEGAIISMPLKEAVGRRKSFIYGMLSGAVEPAGAAIMLLLFRYLAPALPYLLAFAAGAMIYVVVEELIPESAQGEHSNMATLGFAAGFILMMILDTALG